MLELYLISRLSMIQGIFIILAVVSLIIIVTLMSAYIVDISEGREKIAIKYSFLALIIGILGAIITPTTEQALMIYGVGSTLEYLKDNKDARNIPDKTIKALDTYLDKYIEKEDK